MQNVDPWKGFFLMGQRCHEMQKKKKKDFTALTDLKEEHGCPSDGWQSTKVLDLEVIEQLSISG